MFRGALFIARKELFYALRARETILWVFVMPIVFFYFIGSIAGGGGGTAPGKTRMAVRLGENPGFLAQELLAGLDRAGFEVVPSESDEDFAGFSRRLDVPDDFTTSVLEGEKTVLRYALGGEGLGGDFDRVRLQRAVYTLLADLVVAGEAGDEPSAESLERLRTLPRTVLLEVSEAGRRLTIPSGFEQAIPGTMVMFTLLVLLTSGAVLLVIERRQGLLRRLASCPISRGSVVLGKWAGKLVLGLVQIAFAMLAGTVLFGMDWGDQLLGVGLVLIAWAALCASLGMLLGSLARTEGQAIGLGVVAANLLAALGGCWWPIEVTPRFMQALSQWLPTGWAMDAMHKLVSFHAPASEALPNVVGMVLAAVVVGIAAARVFRYE